MVGERLVSIVWVAATPPLRYIYNHESCGRCGGAIASWDMAGRTCYACHTCQPLAAGAALATGRAKALAGAKQAKVRGWGGWNQAGPLGWALLLCLRAVGRDAKGHAWCEYKWPWKGEKWLSEGKQGVPFVFHRSSPRAAPPTTRPTWSLPR